MADHPMLFSAPMIRALLEGRKTQTRRIIKPLPNRTIFFDAQKAGLNQYQSPHIKSGDRIWVRENVIGEELYDGQDGVRYLADNTFIPIDDQPYAVENWLKLHTYRRKGSCPKLRGYVVPSIHMPRWASRLTLIVEGVKVERLQDISEADAIAEGIMSENMTIAVNCYGGLPVEERARRFFKGTEPDDFDGEESAQDAFANIWEAVNGPGAWDENPWVVAYTFRVVHANIDKIGGGHV